MSWPLTAQKNFPTDLVTFTEEILNGKLDFFCSVMRNRGAKIELQEKWAQKHFE